MESQISTYSNKKYSYQILENLLINLEITYNPYNLPLEELFVMAARRNKKRSFLFVSKILGKHLPIRAAKSLLTGLLLADQYALKTSGKSFAQELKLSELFTKEYPEIPEAFIPSEISPVIIGFAETATALGQSFFAAFQKADYFHTTRELVSKENPVITFEEEHSHATSHRCYVSTDLLDNDREIVLVDDEMSTGKTAINIIRSIHAEFPRKVYTVVSILDWRSDEDVARFNQLEKELGIQINSVSLLKGNFSVAGHSPEKEFQSENQHLDMPDPVVEKVFLDEITSEFVSGFYGGKLEGIQYAAQTGRFGMSVPERDLLDGLIQKMAETLSEKITAKRILLIGTGEFMYIPMKTAALMQGDISYQSTTRSPIHIVNKEGYGARHGMAFPNPEEPEIQHFLYNVAPCSYDEAVIFFEREVPDEWLNPFVEQLRISGIPSIKIVFYHSRQVAE